MHVLGPPEDYPGVPSRLYTPTDMPFAAYDLVANRLGLQRVVLVQPSAYGTDNRCMLDAMKQLPGRSRGVAVVGPAVAENTLESMHAVGVRGVRLNLMTPRITDAAAAERLLEPLASRIARFGWHLQVYADPAIVAPIAPVIRRLRVPVVLDHMAGVRSEQGVDHPDFTALLQLLRDDGCWVKLSGADIVTGNDRDFAAAAAPYVRALVAANPGRLVWGTDWPHLFHFHGAHGDASPLARYRPVDEAELLQLLHDCADSDATFARILVDNPERLYQF